MPFRCLKGDKRMQYTLNMGQYVTPLNTILFPNTAYTIISKTGVPLLQSPALGNCTSSRACTNWTDRSSTTVISAQQIGDHRANKRQGTHQHQIHRSKHGSVQQVLSGSGARFPFLLQELFKYLMNCHHMQNIQKFISPSSQQERRCLTQPIPQVLLNWRESHLQ